MLKNFAAKQQNPVVEDNMSNLTSASNEASVSSSNPADNHGGGGGFSQVQCSFPPSRPPPAKKKRNQPGHPDPDAEVIALSPTSLMATNRFVCEICSKGFPRDQNLQLHRRGHNLPWKLKQRSPSKDACRRKVYVCPVSGCVHHDPGRALGDLTGIKKHFYRKHGEKKWKCDKCSKKYAVQSDWKAHSKTCGTKEYRCDCGTIFSRRDSFITHRAFCDALAEESARSTPQPKNTAAIYIPAATNNPQQIQSQFSDIYHHQIPLFPSIKKEPKNLAALLRPPPPPPSDFISPWLSSFHPPTTILGPTPAPSSSIFQHLQQNQDFSPQNPNPNPQPVAAPFDPRLPPYPSPPPPPPQISATALLQKAAQMGAKSSGPHQYPTPATDMSDPGHAASATASFGLNLSSRDGLVGVQSSLFQNVIMGNPETFDHHGHLRRPEFEETAFDGGHDEESLDFQAAMDGYGRAEDGGGQVSDGMTRDFLGLRGLSQSDILSMAGLSRCMGSNGGGGNEI